MSSISVSSFCVFLSRQCNLVKQLSGNFTAVAGLVILTIFVLIGILAPLITEPNFPDHYRLRRDMLSPLLPPGSPGHPLGTDNSGADILYGLIWGCRLSIRVSLTIALFAALIGTLIGTTAGYFGRVVDEFLMRITDVFFAIPPYILAMAVLASLGATLQNLQITLIVVFWPRFARVIRAQVISTKELAYVMAAEALGMSHTRIILRHVLPNSIAPMFVQVTLSIGELVLWTAGLSFIGLAPTGLTEWGNMVSLGKDDMIGGYWWPALFPGIMILMFVLGANLLGDGLRDILDPKLRGVQR